MAPATSGRPKRKRQRKRRTQLSSDDDSSSSSDSDNDSGSSSSSEDGAPVKPVETLPIPATAAAPAEADSSDSDDSSSSSDSDLSDTAFTGRRRGRGRRKALDEADRLAGRLPPGSTLPSTSAAAAPTPTFNRPYPERSPSPERRTVDPAHVALGMSVFPLLMGKVSVSGGRVLEGLVEGDDEEKEGEKERVEEEQERERKEREEGRERKFGEWWRERLVGEFEGDLGGLAAVRLFFTLFPSSLLLSLRALSTSTDDPTRVQEPGLSQSRLQLLLSSLTTLSTLHTTSSSASASSRSIWAHSSTATLDPLASLPPAAGGEGEEAEAWAGMKVGGEGDVEVGAEGVEMGEEEERRKREKRERKERRRSGKKEKKVDAGEAVGEKMDVDE